MNAEALLDRPYHIRLQQRDDGDGPYWFATVEELRGCMSDGDTEAEALDSVRDAMHGWISAALEAGRLVPEPHPDAGNRRTARRR
ncbi:MAG: type II toxin-antitoxin system HicB family antitoxin [Chloroflexi bacterium]|nr:type II toxin-antitoxin system HicB family antitoxin [Chloroflexota bacterium]